MKALVIDIPKCNGCYNCQIACKDEHVGNDWMPYARPQPNTGQFWLKLKEETRGSVPKVKVTYEPLICQHCDTAPCISACKNEAIYKREDGLVIIDPGRCTGQRNCIDACPYGVIYFNESMNLSQKCTGCAHLLDDGWKEPRCVDACPTDALIFGEEEDLKDLIGRAEILHSEFNTNPRVYYIGLPRKFIAGAVYDPEKDEVIEGAKVTLTESKSDKRYTAETDNYGDFWFEGLDGEKYSLVIEKEGYRPKEVESISSVMDLNLGDIELNSIG